MEDELIEADPADLQEKLAALATAEASLRETTFASIADVKSRISELSPSAELTDEQLRDLVTREGTLEVQGLQPIGEATYGLLTFGALIFAVAGLYLQQTRKLKFGVIEMEKTATAQSTDSVSLGIPQ